MAAQWRDLWRWLDGWLLVRPLNLHTALCTGRVYMHICSLHEEIDELEEPLSKRHIFFLFYALNLDFSSVINLPENI